MSPESSYFIFPEFDPVAIALGPIVVRWYALAYIFGILIGWRYMLYLAKKPPALVKPNHCEDMITWATLGTIIGGRLGHVLLWDPGYYFSHPLEILMVWKGGMAFHGGLVGVIVAMIIYSRRAGIPFFALSDLAAAATPIGLGLGRLANFINGELVGRPTDMPWAMIFPHVDNLPRHPSQIYEALTEGLLLFVILAVLAHQQKIRERLGTLSGVFLIGYAFARMFSEMFREPETLTGTLVETTWGQWLSVPMLVYGLYLVWRGRRTAAIRNNA
jgi:phosphatidylglycerol:prolipoprotein diacylglycerol transferase